jgi:hypothetical protein
MRVDSILKTNKQKSTHLFTCLFQKSMNKTNLETLDLQTSAEELEGMSQMFNK